MRGARGLYIQQDSCSNRARHEVTCCAARSRHPGCQPCLRYLRADRNCAAVAESDSDDDQRPGRRFPDEDGHPRRGDVWNRRQHAEDGRQRHGADVALLFAPFPEALATGNIVANSATVIARLRLGVAVKKGAPKPDISTADAVRRTLLNAASIVAIDPAGSAGGAVLMALDKLGLTAQLKPKIVWLANAGMVQDSVAKGQYELALGPYISEMRNPGVDIVGALPPEAAPPIDITGFISTTTRNAQAARALLDYLSSPAATPAYQGAKIFPVH